MAKRRRKNCVDLDGIVLLDKAQGVTSNQALQQVKNLYRACKAGHTGSLDPIATGLLPLCFGEATKISQFLLNADKRYWARFQLGVETNTYDADGDVVADKPVDSNQRQVERALNSFLGEIDQIPPMFSAVKQNGKALYKLAREGIEVERAPRRVNIFDIRILGMENDQLELEIHCSKGTYVRALAHDLGTQLGCGAHMSALRRLQVGELDISRAVTLVQLQAATPETRQAWIRPIDEALVNLPDVMLTELATHYLLQGQPVSVQHGHPPGWVRLYEPDQGFIGMGEVLDDGRVAPKRIMRNLRKA
ncbi:MAG: tRNA pseudouridine(55) synthase TruB [Gammaproteobacteria bacterium]|nr:MAG: tRNA pseudouridine(55) synthase TruB [Gammaproteobacteria bacterium]